MRVCIFMNKRKINIVQYMKRKMGQTSLPLNFQMFPFPKIKFNKFSVVFTFTIHTTTYYLFLKNKVFFFFS